MRAHLTAHTTALMTTLRSTAAPAAQKLGAARAAAGGLWSGLKQRKRRFDAAARQRAVKLGDGLVRRLDRSTAGLRNGAAALRERTGQAFAPAARGAARITRPLRRGLSFVLAGPEKVLLSSAWRERIHASATFAMIFAFAVTSLDFMISGGFDFGARAAQPQSQIHASMNAAVERNRHANAEIAPAMARDANVVQVSQTFAEAAEPEAAAPALEAVETTAPEEVAGSTAQLRGNAPAALREAANETAETEGPPRKHNDAKPTI